MWVLVSVLLSAALAALAVVYLQPRWAMRIVRAFAPAVLWDVEGCREKCVALTIDDVPGRDIDEILEILNEYEARATFFVIGSYAAARPDVVPRIVNGGNEVGHHMWEDGPSWKLSRSEFIERFERAEHVITEQLKGAQQLGLFRPGSGFFTPRMLKDVQARKYRAVLGSVYPFDPQVKFSAVNAWHVCRGIFPGAIIILHDRPHTPSALRTILEHLKSNGYRCVTVSELLQTR